jgi:hypothetical protein
VLKEYIEELIKESDEHYTHNRELNSHMAPHFFYNWASSPICRKVYVYNIKLLKSEDVVYIPFTYKRCMLKVIKTEEDLPLLLRWTYG